MPWPEKHQATFSHFTGLAPILSGAALLVEGTSIFYDRVKHAKSKGHHNKLGSLHCSAQASLGKNGYYTPPVPPHQRTPSLSISSRSDWITRSSRRVEVGGSHEFQREKRARGIHGAYLWNGTLYDENPLWKAAFTLSSTFRTAPTSLKLLAAGVRHASSGPTKCNLQLGRGFQ